MHPGQNVEHNTGVKENTGRGEFASKPTIPYNSAFRTGKEQLSLWVFFKNLVKIFKFFLTFSIGYYL
jgi:hypothetical protein